MWRGRDRETIRWGIDKADEEREMGERRVGGGGADRDPLYWIQKWLEWTVGLSFLSLR